MPRDQRGLGHGDPAAARDRGDGRGDGATGVLGGGEQRPGQAGEEHAEGDTEHADGGRIIGSAEVVAAAVQVGDRQGHDGGGEIQADQ
jgi:hypothetical protein